MHPEPRPSDAPSSGGLRTLPRKFGRYMLFDRIGQGGMAEIFLARTSTELGGARLAVVKQILVEYADHAEFADMLTYEAKLAARLSHTNVVQVLDLGREDGQLFIAMEYVEGFDLNALLRRCSQQKVPLPVEFALYVVASALSGLDYAHRRTDESGKGLGIVHRDVSPSNLLVSFDGEVKVCDFGIAHANDLVAGSVSAPEAIKGKAGYMSPEHARGEALDARADVFAAGIVLWELLAGHRMYRQDQSRDSLLELARKAEIPALPERGFVREKELHAIVKKALARDKADRFASAGAMLRELEATMAAAGQMVSPIRMGEWLVQHFGEEIIRQRRTRERAAAAVALGPLVQMTPIGISERALKAADPLPSKPAPPPPESHVPSSLVATTVDVDDDSSRALAEVPEERSRPLRREKKATPAARFAVLLVVGVVLALVVSRLAQCTGG